jgi:beta-lactamase class A
MSAASRPITHKGGRRSLLALVVAGLLSVGMLSPGTVEALTMDHAASRVQTISPQAALERLMTAPHYQASWFAPAFLAQITPAQLEQGRATIIATLGSYQRVQPQRDGSFLIRFQHGTIRAQIHLDAQGRIDGLFFGPPQLTHLTLATELQRLRRLPGRVSVLVLTNGVATTAINDRQALAVGSAFKLAVLLALRHQIAAGKLAWDQRVTLHAKDKTYSSPALQHQPAGSRFTVARLATFMISVSDNTAADLLIHLVGRAAIDPLIPAQDRPILTTHELFVLKDPAHRALRAQYLRAAPARRLAILHQADRLALPALTPMVRLLARGPVAPEIEYFFSTRQLCALMWQVQDLPAMHANPGVADPKVWQSVAYKGGSEPGVLNLTTLVRARRGATDCVSATWNNAALLNETQFAAVYGSLLGALPR